MNTKAIVNSLTIETLRQGNHTYQFNKAVVNALTAAFFDPKIWQKEDKVLGTAQGRGTTWFLKHNEHELVLRHYYRGGLIGKLLKDGYLYSGEKRSRPYQEFELLCQMHQQGLPVPEPVAYALHKHGIYYTADIMTKRIAAAKDVVGLLSVDALTEDTWFDIGAVIKKFHLAGINHHDLNCHNILIDPENKVWLIDFDQGKKMSKSGQWQQNNLDRLKRSFLKEQNRLPIFHWKEDNWLSLMKGYQLNS